DQQTQLDRVRGDALDRENRLREFGERFAAVENLGGLVSALTAQVDGLEGAVKVILELRESLRDAQGNAVDVSGLVKQVARLPELVTALNGVDGRVVRMRDVELQLRELRDAVGIGGDGSLDTRIDTSVNQAEVRLNVKADERASAADARLDTAIEAQR